MESGGFEGNNEAASVLLADKDLFKVDKNDSDLYATVHCSWPADQHLRQVTPRLRMTTSHDPTQRTIPLSVVKKVQRQR